MKYHFQAVYLTCAPRFCVLAIHEKEARAIARSMASRAFCIILRKAEQI